MAIMGRQLVLLVLLVQTSVGIPKPPSVVELGDNTLIELEGGITDRYSNPPLNARLEKQPSEVGFLTGIVFFDGAVNETHVGGYDMMFSMTPDPATRMGFAHSTQGEKIIPTRPDKDYEIDLKHHPIPFGAKYILIFAGHPGDENVPAVIPLFPTAEETQALIAEQAASKHPQFTIELPAPKPDPRMQSVQRKQDEGLARTPAETNRASDDSRQSLTQIRLETAMESKAEATTAQEDPTAYKPPEFFTNKESDYQPKSLSMRLEENVENKKVRGVVAFQPAVLQRAGIASYTVWWASECNNNAKVRDYKAEEASGALMAFHVDINGGGYERYFDYRLIPYQAMYIMVMTVDEHGVPLCEPICKGPLDLMESSTGTTNLKSYAPGKFVVQDAGAYPEGTENLGHHAAMAAKPDQPLSVLQSDVNLPLKPNGEMPILAAKPDKSLSVLQNDANLPLKPVGNGGEVPPATLVQKALVKATKAADNVATKTNLPAIVSQSDSAQSNFKPDDIPSGEGEASSHIAEVEKPPYMLPWAPRPSIVPSPYLTSQSPSASPLPSQPPVFDSSILTRVDCTETPRSPRDMELITTGPNNDALSGIVRFRAAHEVIPNAVNYAVRFAKLCANKHIIPDHDIDDLQINTATPHQAYESVISARMVPENSYFILVVATSAEKVPVGDPVCMPVIGGHCPLEAEHYSNITKCDELETKYAVQDVGFSTPGVLNGQLSGVLSFSDVPIIKNGLQESQVGMYYARLSKTCTAQGEILTHGAHYDVKEWVRDEVSTTYTGTLDHITVPTGARYILIFAADATGNPLGQPVGVPLTGLNNGHIQPPIVKLAKLDVADLVRQTEQARFRKTQQAILAIPGIIQVNTVLKNTDFEIMEVSIDDVMIPYREDQIQATLYGVPENVKQHVISFTPYLPYLRRVALLANATEKADFRYFLMARLTTDKVFGMPLNPLGPVTGPVLLEDSTTVPIMPSSGEYHVTTSEGERPPPGNTTAEGVEVQGTAALVQTAAQPQPTHSLATRIWNTFTNLFGY